VTTTAIESLVKTSGLQPRQPAPSPALTDAHRKVSQLIARWDDALADSIAAENLFLDDSKERRRAPKSSACTKPSARAHQGRASTSWKMPCADAGR
jgi:hypothetical protein